MKQILTFLIVILMFLGNGLLFAQIENDKTILVDEEGKIQGFVPDFNLCNPIKLKILGDNVDYDQWELFYRYQEKLTDPWTNPDMISGSANIWEEAIKSEKEGDNYLYIPPKLIQKPRIAKKETKYKKDLDTIRKKSKDTEKSEYKRNSTAAKYDRKQIKWSNKIETRTKNYADRKSKNYKYYLVYNLVKNEKLAIDEIKTLDKVCDEKTQLLVDTEIKLKNFNACISPEKIKLNSIKKNIAIINSNIKTLKKDRDAYLKSNECCIETILINIQKKIDELQDSLTYYQQLIFKPGIIVDGSTDNIKTLEEKKTKLETEISEIEKKLNSNRYLVKHLGVIVLGKNTIQPYYNSEYKEVQRTTKIKTEVIGVDRLGDYPEIIEGDFIYPTLLNVQYKGAKENPIRMISKLTVDKNPPLYDPGFAPMGAMEKAQLEKTLLPKDTTEKIEFNLDSAYTDLVFSVGKPVPGNYKLSVEFKTMGDSTIQNTTEEVTTDKVNEVDVTPEAKKINYHTTTKKYEYKTISLLKDVYPTSHKLYRFGAAFGLLGSFMNNPEYSKELVAEASPETGGQDIYIINEKNDYSLSLRPTVFFNINIKRVDLQKKKMNCYERLSIGLGFDLDDITKNFYAGLNVSIWRNFLISTGAHFGQVDIISGEQDYNSSSGVNTTSELRVGFYVGLQWNYNIGSIIKKWNWK